MTADNLYTVRCGDEGFLIDDDFIADVERRCGDPVACWGVCDTKLLLSCAVAAFLDRYQQVKQ